MKLDQNESNASPVYVQIALDIAARIMNGNLPQNTKIYGRSIMSSEYSVSPETIRRSLKLLSDVGVVEIHHNSGAVVKSIEQARAYVRHFSERSGIRDMQKQLKQLISDHVEQSRRILELTTNITKFTERFSVTNPLHNYEAEISAGSPVTGKTLSELQFWQKTGATVIAVRRNEKLLLSPGPYIQLLPGDAVIFIGDVNAVQQVHLLLQNDAASL
ncbi:MAG: GntR family transcriptional regulator [Treponema sp.]|jgi:K+/H+ antiporter YhaU regulatory subunit KhtT|nr:GntR family transcriptional regulator [Treponema sp.]